jgi:D-alanyl-D-alanine dipeptidase
MKKIKIFVLIFILIYIFWPFLITKAQSASNPECLYYTSQTTCSGYHDTDAVMGKCDIIKSTYKCCRNSLHPSYPPIFSKACDVGVWTIEEPDKDKCAVDKKCCCHAAIQQTQTAVQANPPKFKMPEMQINIPTVKLTPEITCDTDDQGNYECKIPWLGQYLSGIYEYGLSIAGILAAIILMAGGVLWLISGGDASKITQAKELIIGSITGLIILMSSYIILIQVNPDLVKMKSLTIGYIEKMIFVENGSDSETNVVSTGCPSANNLTNINNLVATSNVNDPRLTKEATEGLKKAIAEATKQNATLLVTSANRTYETQKKLWDDELKKNNGDEAKTRKYVASPTNCQGTCYSHCAGVAIDVCLKGSPSCSKMKAAYATYSHQDIVKLQDIMKKAGWVRYCAEWWHFQYGTNPKQACSP